MFSYEDSSGNIRSVPSGIADISLIGDPMGFTGFSNNPGNFESTFRDLVQEQKDYNQLQMAREDSAYQRMVVDMQKAGLNPWTGIATGGSSSSSLIPPSKSGMETLLNILKTSNDAMSKEANTILGSVNAGAKIALGILGLFF